MRARSTLPLTLALSLFPGATGLAAPTEPNTLVNPLAPSAAQCGTCHAFVNPPAQQDTPNHSPMVWQGSAMAHSARDPVFWGALALAAQDHPEETIDCVRCHVPNAFLEGRGDVVDPTGLEPADLDGIGCDLCHRMLADPTTPVGNARYTLDDTAINGAVAKAGPWSYAGEAPNHPWRQDTEFLPSGDACGVCHDVTTERPRLADDGTVLAEGFNEQRTFSEWRNSAYAEPGPDQATCQDCHMPAVDDVGGCAAFSQSGLTHPTGGRRHDLAGPNKDLTALMRASYGAAGTDEIDEAFYDASSDAQDRILAQAAQLSVDAPAEIIDSLSLQVTVENLTGHKLPSGYSEGRVMWLEVAAFVDGVPRFGSGRLIDDDIEDDPQVRRYEGVAERLSDGTRNHLLLNDHWVRDTRIPPRGLRPDPETDPITDRYTLQDDGTWPSRDIVDYTFALDEDTLAALDDLARRGEPTVEVEVRVRYLINTPTYLAQLAADNVTNDAGNDVVEAFAALGGPGPLTLATWTAAIPYTGHATSDGGGTASEDGGTTASGDGGANSDGATDPGCGCGVQGPEYDGLRGLRFSVFVLLMGLFGGLRDRRSKTSRVAFRNEDTADSN